MEKRTRRNCSSDFKTKVVLEALKERYSIEEIARKHELHPNQVTTWKKEFLNNATAVFDGTGVNESNKEKEVETEKLYEQIGRQKVEIEWLKKKLQ